VTSPSRKPIDLQSEIQYLRGVGPHRARQLKTIGVLTIGDLLSHFPSRHQREEARLIENLDEGIVATVVGQVAAVRSTFGRGGKTVRATLLDNTGRCSLTWFHAGWMEDKLERGMILRATGRVGEYHKLPQLVNPKFEILNEETAEPVDESESPEFLGVYPATAQISSKAIAKLIGDNLEAMLAAVVETLPDEIVQRRTLRPRRWAIRTMHRPDEESALDAARRRLAYEELLLMQLAVMLVRRERGAGGKAIALTCTDLIDERIRARFPFALTAAQDRAVKSIAADLSGERPMNRLLQGDVGCGKTVVALYAALTAIANKTQVAIMAPTELLADQHYRSIEKYLADSRVRYTFLTGSRSRRDRSVATTRIARGDMDLVVGTHALIQGDVRFRRLGLAIVDEQHRFGVRQRASMRDKGVDPHFLVMTATPIPRTLALTAFGDLDVTVIDGLPPGRSPIETRLYGRGRDGDAWRFVQSRLDEGEQAYVVYPIIDESDKLQLRAATAAFEDLAKRVFPDRRVGLLHGRMTKSERDEVMSAFIAGELDILVATTVIEVGIDVPNATCMVVEHAERYGLSQLHQLRGRVGRGDQRGYCLLMTEQVAPEENERLSVMTRTTDGFQIAEEDLRLRGPGEMLGTRQHGLPELRVANLASDVELLMLAREDAGELLREDPNLSEGRHRALRDALRAQYAGARSFFKAG